MNFLTNEIDFFKFLESFHWTNLSSKQHNSLQNMKDLSILLGNPQDSVRIIHITGSKGKGSVSHIISSILEVSGAVVGLYTSPHIHSYRERIQVNNQFAPLNSILNSANKIISFINKKQINPNILSAFELLTVICFDVWKTEKVKFGVLEVGIGGKQDSTNIANGEIAVLTPIELEHCHILGNTLEEITTEKSGIIKHNATVFTSNTSDNIINIIKQTTISQKGILLRLNTAEIKNIQYNDKGTNFIFKDIPYYTNLIGSHQAINASLAIEVIKYIKPHITNDIINCGLKNIKIKGRTEIIQNNKFFVMMDCCHTINSIKCCIETFNSLKRGNIKNTLIFSSSKNKNIQNILIDIAKQFDNIIITNCSSPHGVDTDMLIETLSFHSNVTFTNNPTDAVNDYLNDINNISSNILIAGSIFLISDIRDILLSKIV